MIQCRNCQKDIHVKSYFGFCCMACCGEFSIKNKILLSDAKFSYGSDTIERLEEEVDELKNDVYYFENENEEYYSHNRELERTVSDLGNKIETLKSLDWEKIKKQRYEEKKNNDDIKREKERVEKVNERVEKVNERVKQQIKDVRKQNQELLDCVKEMKSHSDRFQQLDLGYE